MRNAGLFRLEDKLRKKGEEFNSFEDNLVYCIGPVKNITLPTGLLKN